MKASGPQSGRGRPQGRFVIVGFSFGEVIILSWLPQAELPFDSLTLTDHLIGASTN